MTHGSEVILRRGRAPKATYADVGALLRECRARLGLSQVKLAELLVRHVGQVQDWEEGRCRMSGTVRRRLVELVRWKETGVAPWTAAPFE